MKREQNKIELAKPTQEQIEFIFTLWDHDIKGQKDLKMRVEMTRAYLHKFDYKDIWKYKTNDYLSTLGTLILQKSLYQLMGNTNSKNSVSQVKEVFSFLKEKGFSPVEDLSQEDRDYLEFFIIERQSDLVKKTQENKTNITYEKQLIEFIEEIGLFQNVSKKETLEFVKRVVASNSIHLLKWLFSRGLSPNTMIEQNNDKWPLASFSPTMDMLNVFISYGANLALTSEKGFLLSSLLSKRIDSINSVMVRKEYCQIINTVCKAEMATQVNPQKHLWELINKAKNNIEIMAAIKSYEDVCDLRDEKGRHIVQFAMLHNPTCVNAILSVNKKTLALGTTPDEHGRLPSIYWIANNEAQKIIHEEKKITVFIPNKIDEKMWYQASELISTLEINLIGLCSNEVKRRFEETTGKNLNEWIEEEAKNGSQWFERMMELAVKRAKNDINNIKFASSDIINMWADPDNHSVVNEAHALFRAHLMLNTLMLKNNSIYYGYDSSRYKNKINNFFKIHLVGKAFDALKTQINDEISFMGKKYCNELAESQWWQEICVKMEREYLLGKHADINKIIVHNKFDAL